MDKVLKEKIINNTFEGIDKIIESQHKDHPNESSYSICRIQEGYNDYLKITFRKGKINYFRRYSPNIRFSFSYFNSKFTFTIYINKFCFFYIYNFTTIYF